jgi:hypothetical protein
MSMYHLLKISLVNFRFEKIVCIWGISTTHTMWDNRHTKNMRLIGLWFIHFKWVPLD